MTKSVEDLNWRTLLALILTALVAVLMSYGCMMVDPGGQSARSLDQRFKVFWENDTLQVETRGPHEASWEVAGGELVLIADDTGNTILDPARSKIEYWLRYYPSAEVAGEVAPVYAQEGTAQMQLVVPPLTQVLMRAIEALENAALKPVDDGGGP